MKFIMHFADLSHCFKEKQVAFKISKLVVKEFQNQSKQEEELGLERTPYFLNLDKYINMLQSEKMFITQIIQPQLGVLSSLGKLRNKNNFLI